MTEELVWPDPVPCRPENPVQGIRQCEALRTNSKCRWLDVTYCGVGVERMGDALELLGLDNFAWLLEDDVDAAEVQEAARQLRGELVAIRAETGKQAQALSAVRWFAQLLSKSSEHGYGLSGRFRERLGLKDRY